MTRLESGSDFGNIDLEAATDVANRWFQLPAYTEVPKDVLERLKHLTELQGPVKDFVDQHLADVKALLEQSGYNEALVLINQGLSEIDTRFAGDDSITARVFTLRRRAYIKEANATFGELSKFPLGNTERNSCFISAAADYMQADLELGSMSDFALRVSECFGGARLGKYQVMALQKALGDNVMLVSKDSGADMVALSDLMRRATETVEIGEVPGGGKAKIVSGKLPDSRTN